MIHDATNKMWFCIVSFVDYSVEFTPVRLGDCNSPLPSKHPVVCVVPLSPFLVQVLGKLVDFHVPMLVHFDALNHFQCNSSMCKN